MKVFGITPSTCYGGGLVVIAANNADEAWQTIIESDDYNLDIIEFNKNDLHEIHHLSTDLKEREIIIYDVYFG